MATRNIFELDTPPNPPAQFVILGSGNDRIVWKALAGNAAGWYHRHVCGRIVHQWLAPKRPSHVVCPSCAKWVPAP
jgi:hypothetical protein